MADYSAALSDIATALGTVQEKLTTYSPVKDKYGPFAAMIDSMVGTENSIKTSIDLTNTHLETLINSPDRSSTITPTIMGEWTTALTAHSLAMKKHTAALTTAGGSDGGTVRELSGATRDSRWRGSPTMAVFRGTIIRDIVVGILRGITAPLLAPFRALAQNKALLYATLFLAAFGDILEKGLPAIRNRIQRSLDQHGDDLNDEIMGTGIFAVGVATGSPFMRSVGLAIGFIDNLWNAIWDTTSHWVERVLAATGLSVIIFGLLRGVARGFDWFFGISQKYHKLLADGTRVWNPFWSRMGDMLRSFIGGFQQFLARGGEFLARTRVMLRSIFLTRWDLSLGGPGGWHTDILNNLRDSIRSGISNFFRPLTDFFSHHLARLRLMFSNAWQNYLAIKNSFGGLTLRLGDIYRNFTAMVGRIPNNIKLMLASIPIWWTTVGPWFTAQWGTLTAGITTWGTNLSALIIAETLGALTAALTGIYTAWQSFEVSSLFDKIMGREQEGAKHTAAQQDEYFDKIKGQIERKEITREEGVEKMQKRMDVIEKSDIESRLAKERLAEREEPGMARWGNRLWKYFSNWSTGAGGLPVQQHEFQKLLEDAARQSMMRHDAPFDPVTGSRRSDDEKYQLHQTKTVTPQNIPTVTKLTEREIAEALLTLPGGASEASQFGLQFNNDVIDKLDAILQSYNGTSGKQDEITQKLLEILKDPKITTNIFPQQQQNTKPKVPGYLQESNLNTGRESQ